MVLHAPGADAECVTFQETLKKKAAEEKMKKRQAVEKAQQKVLKKSKRAPTNRVKKQRSASVNWKSDAKQTR